MMRYAYDAGWSMMGGGGLFGTLLSLVLLIDLILVGVWLWKQVSK